MSVMQTKAMSPLQFYRSSPAPCPYLPGRIERKLFARLGTGAEGIAVNSSLSHAGFRRSHDIIYRPACPACTACIPVRVPVNTFAATGTLGRIWRRAQTLTLTEVAPEATREQYDLFITYETRRHFDSDMANMTFEDYSAMIREGQAQTTILELRAAEGKLMGLMLADRLQDGYSAVYSFFSTVDEDAPFSLGTLLILHLIETARQRTLPYVYLGYWVEGSRKMDYKSRFRPYEALGPEGWAVVP